MEKNRYKYTEGSIEEIHYNANACKELGCKRMMVSLLQYVPDLNVYWIQAGRLSNTDGSIATLVNEYTEDNQEKIIICNAGGILYDSNKQDPRKVLIDNIKILNENCNFSLLKLDAKIDGYMSGDTMVYANNAGKVFMQVLDNMGLCTVLK